MIGFFDSGLGGIETMRHFRKELPHHDMIFLADNAYMPYGEKTPETIQQRTFLCVDWLFTQGAKIVILACNTASAYAIKQRQLQYPHKKLLSVTIPGIEALWKSNVWHATVLATKATKKSDIYTKKFRELFPEREMIIDTIDAGERVTMIEQGKKDMDLIEKIMKQINPKTETLLLGCTHFPIIQHEIEQFFNWPIINPSAQAAQSFVSYFSRHPEISSLCTRHGQTQYFTTGSIDHIQSAIQTIYQESILCKNIGLSK